MRFAKVVGRMSFSKAHPSIEGKRWLLVAPMSLANLAEGTPVESEELVVIDELGAAVGDVVSISEGMEAAFPYMPKKTPIDAYAALIVDEMTVDSEIVGKLRSASS